MTTIVWDGKTLASDGRMTKGNQVAEDNRQKIFVDGQSQLKGATVICYALAGAADMYDRIGDWIKDGCPYSKDGIPTDWGEAYFEVIIITTEHAFVYNSSSNDILEVFGGEVLGSGGEFAQTALHMGKDAKSSVKIAAQMDLFSGGTGMFINCRTKKMVLKEFACGS